MSDKTILEITLKFIDTDNEGTVTELSFNKWVKEEQAEAVLREYLRIPQLTIEELREQFENHFKDIYSLFDFFKYEDGLYKCLKTQRSWYSWQECARANNILKDGE